jgi:hypothetical protein
VLVDAFQKLFGSYSAASIGLLWLFKLLLGPSVDSLATWVFGVSAVDGGRPKFEASSCSSLFVEVTVKKLVSHRPLDAYGYRSVCFDSILGVSRNCVIFQGGRGLRVGYRRTSSIFLAQLLRQAFNRVISVPRIKFAIRAIFRYTAGQRNGPKRSLRFVVKAWAAAFDDLEIWVRFVRLKRSCELLHIGFVAQHCILQND